MAQTNRSPVASGARQQFHHVQEDAAHTAIPKTAQAECYVVHLMPQPGVDGIRSLRAFLKTALRRYGLRCTAARGDGRAVR